MTKSITAASLSVALLFGPSIAKADVVLDWNEIMVAVVNDQPPPFMNRFAVITQLAVFEAVNAVTGDHKSWKPRLWVAEQMATTRPTRTRRSSVASRRS